MKKVYDGTCSISLYIEEDEDGTLDEGYKIESHTYKGKNKSSYSILSKAKDDLFEIKYKDITATFRSRRSKKTYVGKFKGTKEPLWVLSVDKKEWEEAQESIFQKYGVFFTGYSE